MVHPYIKKAGLRSLYKIKILLGSFACNFTKEVAEGKFQKFRIFGELPLLSSFPIVRDPPSVHIYVIFALNLCIYYIQKTVIFSQNGL